MAQTRAGKKRELPSGGKDQVAKKPKDSINAKTQNVKSGAPASLAAQKKKKPKGLMDMPPEIRNRIYHFASERENFEGWERAVPLVESHARHSCGRSQWPMSKYDWSVSARNFLGLTQTCKLVRKEYRPIWLRSSSIRIQPLHLLLYMHTFYGCRTDYSTNMPQLIQISHVPLAEGQEVLNLTHLLRMRAASPGTKIEFIPHELTQEEGPWTVDWEDCDICQDMSPPSEDSEDEDLEKPICPHDEIRRTVYADYLMYEEQPYFGALNKLLAHENAKWLADIRNQEVARVYLDVSHHSDGPEIIIRLAHDGDMVTAELSNKSMQDTASDYIKDCDLESTETEEVKLLFMIQIYVSSHS